jgi:hypothetical protein
VGLLIRPLALFAYHALSVCWQYSPQSSNRQDYSSILSPQAEALIAETWSASGYRSPFYPSILGLPFGQDTNHFMDANFADRGDGEIAQSVGAGAAVANADKIFKNSIRLDTGVSLDHPLTLISHAHPFTPALSPTQFSQSLAAPQEKPDHSHLPSSSAPQPGVFGGFGLFPEDICISPALTPSRQPQRVRSTSQNLQPPS